MKTTQQINGITQLDKANAVLKALAVNVTAEDRAYAMDKSGLSRYTIGSALAGKAKDLDIAYSLIKIFRNRITDREKELSL